MTICRSASPVVALVLALVGVAVSGCGSDGFDFGTSGEQVRGSGEIVVDERAVDGFDHVVLAGEGELSITEGSTESLTVETDDNLLEHIETTVSGGVLRIETESGIDIDPTNSVRYALTVTDLAVLELTGAGSVDMSQWSVSEAKIALTGAGDIEIGTLEASSLEIELPGAGSIGLAGAVEEQQVRLTGVGNYDGADLESRQATINLTGAASSTIWVTDELDVTVTGVGSLDYYGRPTVDQRVTGVGTITARGER